MIRWRCWWPAVALAACTEQGPPGVFDALPQDAELVVGLSAPAQMARDRAGIPHVTATTVGDAAFVQGYVTAHDRLPQMDVLRRFGDGSLAELYGVDDPSVIDLDLEMRLHRMRPLAEDTFAAMSANPDDAELVELLTRYADGVNAYAADLGAQKWTLDPAIAERYSIAAFRAWSPVDSLVILRFHDLAASFTVPFELDLAALHANLEAGFDSSSADPARRARDHISGDLVRFAPLASAPIAGSNSARKPIDAPHVAAPTVAAARAVFASAPRTPGGVLAPTAFTRPFTSDDAVAWHAAGAAVLVADHHEPLANPSMYYPTQLTVPGRVNVVGLALPGVPGVLYGSNGSVAWTAGAAGFDVNDVYAEAPCPTLDCIFVGGVQHSVVAFTEDIAVGDRGFIVDTFTAGYERTDVHGPLIPKLDRTAHRIVPRQLGDDVLAIAYTGYRPSFELRALWNVARAETVQQGLAALADVTYGDQSWTFVDAGGQIAWTAAGLVPQRPAAAYAWKAAPSPDRTLAAPFFVLAGDGTFEWDAAPLAPLPSATSAAYLVATNADPTGATADNDPLNDPPYLGVDFSAGLGQARLTQLVGVAPDAATVVAAPRDTVSTLGGALRDAVVARLRQATGLAADDRVRVDTAIAVLSGWSLATPSALATFPAPPDSAATALFDAWLGELLRETLCDEIANATVPAGDCSALYRFDNEYLVRLAYGIVVAPDSFRQNPSTNEPIVCDDFTTTADESCTTMIIRAAIDAVKLFESDAGFGSANPADWQWGALHQLAIEPLLYRAGDDGRLRLPQPGELPAAGYPRDGGSLTVDRGDRSYATRDASQQRAAAFRLVASTDGVVGDDGSAPALHVQLQLPGGTVFDSRHPHYRDLLDQTYLPGQSLDVPFTVDAIVANGEYRWDFH